MSDQTLSVNQSFPKELAGWIGREPDILSAADVAMATLHLKQFVKKLAA